MSSSDETVKAENRLLRILVPVNADEDSRWGVQYALRRHHEGRELEVIFLNVGEPITQWEVLRFRTQVEISQFQSESAQAFIEQASAPLIAENILCRGCFKQGNVVFSILDTAEELACDEIVMPRPTSCLLQWLANNVSLTAKRQQRTVPVVFVDQAGALVEYRVN
ncbi:MAG: universal stress protein [Sulfuritalea sp.]|nr:universal stress protein [Sulfuritalea sp.]